MLMLVLMLMLMLMLTLTLTLMLMLFRPSWPCREREREREREALPTLVLGSGVRLRALDFAPGVFPLDRAILHALCLCIATFLACRKCRS